MTPPESAKETQDGHAKMVVHAAGKALRRTESEPNTTARHKHRMCAPSADFRHPASVRKGPRVASVANGIPLEDLGLTSDSTDIDEQLARSRKQKTSVPIADGSLPAASIHENGGPEADDAIVVGKTRSAGRKISRQTGDVGQQDIILHEDNDMEMTKRRTAKEPSTR